MNSTGAIRCNYCGRPIANHGINDQLTYVNGEPFHYQCTLPPSLSNAYKPPQSPYDLSKPFWPTREGVLDG
jgi:hypothetical protein